MEPASSGEALLRTDVGPVRVELWCKEAGPAGRRFLELAMVGAYDGTAFHRVVPGLLAQAGRGVGDGSALPVVRNARLRFRSRGVLAVAAGDGEQGDGLQWFFTLEAAPHLDGKHTILGRAVGDSFFNLLRISERQLGTDEAPVEPVVVHGIDIVEQPFPELDGLCRPAVPSATPAPKKPRPLRNRNLLSFSRDEEGDDNGDDKGTTTKANGRARSPSWRMVSSHEALEDPALSTVPAAVGSSAQGSAHEPESPPALKSPKPDRPEPGGKEPTDPRWSDPTAGSTAAREAATLRADLLSQERELSALQLQRARYQKKKRKGAEQSSREEATLAKLAAFGKQPRQGWAAAELRFERVSGAEVGRVEEYEVEDMRDGRRRPRERQRRWRDDGE